MASIRKEGKYYKLYWYVGNKLYKKSLQTGSRSVAERIKRKVEDEIAAGKFKVEAYNRPEKMLDEFLEEAGEYSRNNKSPLTHQRELRIFRNFRDFCKDIPISKITLKLIEAYKVYLLTEKNFKPAGVNIELRHLAATFSLAVKYEYLDKNPFKGIARLKVPKKKPVFLTREQAQLLLEHIRDSELYQYVFIALNTGARISEVCDLRWENIDFRHRTVKLFGKGSKERTVPLTNALSNYLFERRKKSGRVVTGPTHIDTISHLFRKAADELGLIHFTFHNLRDTYASWLVQQGINLKVIQELLGHEAIQTTLIYAHLAPDSRFGAALEIDKQLGEISAPPSAPEVKEPARNAWYGIRVEA